MLASGPATASEVLEFWLGNLAPDGKVPAEVSSRWWKKDPAFDEEIRTRFADTHDRASRGELHDWATAPSGRLALVIVLDQFSRNMFRGEARAFAQDPLAQAHTSAAIASGEDEQLHPIERVFLYMPLMHAENLALQEQCVQCFERLAESAPPALRSMLDNNLEFARQHRDIVARFDRFPHRNAVLGRESTAAEVEFLAGPNSSF